MQTFLRLLTFGLLALAAALALLSAKLRDGDDGDEFSRDRRPDAWQGVFRLGAVRLRIAMDVSHKRSTGRPRTCDVDGLPI